MYRKSMILTSFAPLLGILLLTVAAVQAQVPDRLPVLINASDRYSPVITNFWEQGRLNPAVSGRVFASNDQTGRPAVGAMVYLTDGNGFIRIAQTNWFGYYRFLSVEGNFCVVSVEHKRFRYDAQFASLNEDVIGLNFVPLP